MRTVQIVCPQCHGLVEVVDRIVADHGECSFGGMRYVSSPVYKAGPGAPSVQVLGVKLVKGDCGQCGAAHPTGIEGLLKISMPDPSLN